MIIQIEASGESAVISRRFELENIPSGTAIEVDYLSDRAFLEDEANGYMLSGDPTDKLLSTLDYLEKISKATWRHAISDLSFYDGRPLLAGNTDIISTRYDAAPTEMLAGVGDFDDLKLTEIVHIKNPEIVNASNMNLTSGELSGDFQAAHITENNYYQFMPNLVPGYFHLNGQEYYLFGTKITEIIEPSTPSGITVPDGSYIYELSGLPDNMMPILVSRITSKPNVPCASFPFRTGIFEETYSEFNGNVAPTARMHRISNLASGEALLYSFNDYTSGNTVQYISSSNIVVSDYSGMMLVTYGEMEGPAMNADLSPLSWFDQDRILAFRTGPKPFSSYEVQMDSNTYKDPGFLSVTHMGETISYPIDSISSDLSGDPQKLIRIGVLARDTDLVPMSGIAITMSMPFALHDMSGKPVNMVSGVIVSKMGRIATDDHSRSIHDDNMSIMPIMYDALLDVTDHDTSGTNIVSYIGMPICDLSVGNRTQFPLVAAILDNDVITADDIMNQLVFTKTIVTDKSGHGYFDIWVNGAFGYPRQIELDFSGETSLKTETIAILPDTQVPLSYPTAEFGHIIRRSKILNVLPNVIFELSGTPLMGQYGIMAYDPLYFIAMSGEPDPLSGTRLGDAYFLNEQWYCSPELSGIYAVQYDIIMSEGIVFNNGFNYEQV